MTTVAPESSVENVASPAPRAMARLRKRAWRAGASLLGQGEPMLWLSGSGLVLCVLMIVGLLALVFFQGVVTFWPVPLTRVETVAGAALLGEVARVDEHDLDYALFFAQNGPIQEASGKLLHPRFAARLKTDLAEERFAAAAEAARVDLRRVVASAVKNAPVAQSAPGKARSELLAAIESMLDSNHGEFTKRFQRQMLAAANAASPDAVVASWREFKTGAQAWLGQGEIAVVQQALTPEVGYQLYADAMLQLLATDLKIPMRRRMLRTGNYELTNEHFTWVGDHEIKPGSETRPEWALICERDELGRFYGEPVAFLVNGEVQASEPAQVWKLFETHHPRVQARRARRAHMEKHERGRVSDRQNGLLEELRRVELRHGPGSKQYKDAEKRFREENAELDAEFRRLQNEINALDAENDGYRVVLRATTLQDGGQGAFVEHELKLAKIVRAYPANRLGFLQQLGVYASRWWEFTAGEPREANTEGGVLPAIFGTVVMTLVLSLAVAPFGVMAALYLREYAKAGPLVSSVRIAVNNLAGVPSIVFGLFGMVFFCGVMGGTIDWLFFSHVAGPTFGTGGVLWAALTLALLTLPVVIVATEEALAAVPRSMREGSLACGASKWQTIWRIVLPRAMPGIMTGLILAMARGAGEVAPLMLVGAVKLAPELPVDFTFPFVHLQRSFMHLGFHVYDLGFQSSNSEAAKPMVFTTTLLLIVIIFLLNVTAIYIRARLARKFKSAL